MMGAPDVLTEYFNCHRTCNLLSRTLELFSLAFQNTGNAGLY